MLAENWPGWRAGRQRRLRRERPADALVGHENVRWKAPLHGAGVSAPIVWGERVFVTSSDGRLNDRLHLPCYHRDDGRLLWHARFFGSAVSEGQFAPGGMAVPTPATDGKRVFALFGTGDLVCVDLDGKPVWVRSLAQEYGPFRNRWGMASSPLLAGELLVVQVDHWGQSYLLGVDAATGANRWRTVRDASVNWTSPVAASSRRQDADRRRRHLRDEGLRRRHRRASCGACRGCRCSASPRRWRPAIASSLSAAAISRRCRSACRRPRRPDEDARGLEGAAGRQHPVAGVLDGLYYYARITAWGLPEGGRRGRVWRKHWAASTRPRRSPATARSTSRARTAW